jgi:hypothetical protein
VIRPRTTRPRNHCSDPGREQSLIFSQMSIPIMVASKPSIQWRLGLTSPLVNRPQLEADHSLPFNAEVQEFRLTSNSQYTSMAYTYTKIFLLCLFPIIFRTCRASQKLKRTEYAPTENDNTSSYEVQGDSLVRGPKFFKDRIISKNLWPSRPLSASVMSRPCFVSFPVCVLNFQVIISIT